MRGSGRSEVVSDWPETFRAMLPKWAQRCLDEDHEVGILTSPEDDKREVFCGDCSRGEVLVDG